MPSQARSGIRGVPWSRCDRCGVDYPLDRLTMQNGLLLCGQDFDTPFMFYRDEVVAENLSEGAEHEMENVTSIKREEPNDEYGPFR